VSVNGEGQQVKVSSEEKNVLRELARKVQAISQDPVWEEKKKLWRDKNALRRVRPLVLCSLPEAAWDEIIPESGLVVKDPWFRRCEWELRRRIHRWEHIKDDEVINARIYVPVERTITDWVEGRVRPYADRADHSAKFTPSLHEYGDLGKLRFPEISVDRKLTREHVDVVTGVFGDILEVIEGEPFYGGTDGAVLGWGNGLIDILCELRGLETVFYDLYTEPRFVHEAMDFLMRGTLHYLDAMEKENLLCLNNNEYMYLSNTPLGSNGLACSDELPASSYNPARVTTRDLWGYTQAQEFSAVSPECHEEFVLPYQEKIAARFGLNSYGCCEGNDKKWANIIRHIPRLREVSVSHAADLEIAAETLKGDYVLSWKPHPVTMIATYREEHIRRELRKGFDQLKGCHSIVCLRDTQTLFGEPWRADGWTRVAQEVAAEY
jgi:hypothetical protein